MASCKIRSESGNLVTGSVASFVFQCQMAKEEDNECLASGHLLPKGSTSYLHKLATFHNIDLFFMQARRRVHLLKRPFSVSANARRVWYGYSAYNPDYLVKVAELFRLFYKHIHNDRKDKKTPAVRLGLAKGKVDYEDILYFNRKSFIKPRKAAK